MILLATFAILAFLDPYSHLAFPFLVKIDWYDNLITPLREFGSIWTAAIILGWIATSDFKRLRQVVAAAAAVVAASLAAHALKLLVARARPTTAVDPWTFAAGWGGYADDKYSSFPSGHAACAFALATAIGFMYPSGKVYIFGLAAACGLSRILDARHFPTDVLFGALLGYMAARWIVAREGAPWNRSAAGR